MTSKKTLDLAYCQANSHTAQDISKELQVLGYDINTIVIDAKGVLNPLSILSVSKNPILLLVSDNLFKSEKCMYGIQKLLNFFNIPSELQPIVIDGNFSDDTIKEIPVTTRFDRISDVIAYMNYWQELYLNLEEKKESGDDVDLDQLQRYKDISNNIGDVLTTLKNSPYLRIEEERNIDFDTIISAYGKPKALFIHSSDDETFDSEALSNLEEAQELLESEDQPIAAVPVDSLNPEYDTQLYLDDLEEDDLALLDKIAEQRKNEGDHLKNHPFADLINTEQNIVPSNNRPKNGDFVHPLDKEDEEEDFVKEEKDFIAEGERPYEKEQEHSKPELDSSDEEFELNPSVANHDLVNNKNTDFEDEFVQPQESYESEADPISVVHQLMTEDKIEECIAYLEKAIKKYPYNLDLQYSYAYILTKKKGNYLIATDFLENILNTDKRYTAAYNLLGEIAEKHKDFLLAKSYYEKVISIEPDYQNVHYKVGRIIIQHFSEQDQLALKYFKRAFKHNPKNADAKLEYAKLLYKFGDTKKAIKILRNVMKDAPLSSEAPYELAKIYIEQGDREKSISLFDHAKKLNSDLDTKDNANLFYDAPSLNTQEEDIFSQFDSNRQRKMSTKKRSKIGKTVLVTGATSGIGKATAHLFAQEGYRVIITGRRKNRLKELKKTLTNKYDAAIQHLKFDVQDINSLRKKLGRLEGAWSQIDILINNAGLALGKDPIHEGNIQHWDTMIDTNIKGLLYMTRAISPYMVKRKRGHIINVCSTAGKEVYPNGNVYCATKHAVDALTRAIRLDLYKYNIRVSQVSPAMVEQTEFSKVRYEGDENKAAIYDDFNPLTSTDVADAIYFMASRPAHINVQDIVLMGTQQAGSTYVNRSGRIYDKK
jgi:NADP-dependent 3-hydroxy acid dehydrogenase YdfG/Tfp pilus assembly protein PilF